MKKKRGAFASKYLRRSVWSGLILVLVAAGTLQATALVQYIFSKKGLEEEADRRAQSEMNLAREKIQSILTSVEIATKNLAWLAGYILDTPDAMSIPLRKMLDFNPIIQDAAMAFTENFYPEKGLWYEPLVARRDGDTFEEMVLGSKSHDYFQNEWFTFPIITGEGSWSEPYFDADGAKTKVITYSEPIFNPEGAIVGVAAADISLEWADNMMSEIQLYPDSFSMITSGDGSVIACPSDTTELKDPLRFTTPVGTTGWKVSVVIPKDSIYGDIKRTGTRVLLLQLLGLMMLILILRSSAKNQMKYNSLNEKKEIMENELKIAHGIQMSMLPNIFPPFPERDDIDMHALLKPAKEVGGDLYDFYIRADKLYFCIGDVSGKGVPASLVMAVTRSLFRTASAHERSPLRIVSGMNDSMAEMNENSMFVTFFCGVLDLLTGHLRYCNAGHNAPLLKTRDGVMTLPVVPNVPLGIEMGMVFEEQEADLRFGESLLLYTDGITEAEDAKHALFGEQRLRDAVAESPEGAKKALETLYSTIAGFVGNALQSDDMTTMLIRYMNDKTPETLERHLLLHNDIRQIPQLAGFIETIAQEMNLDQSLAMSLNLALEEAVTNVIMYAYPKGADGLVDIEAVIRKDAIDFTIVDSGKPFDPTAVPDARIDASVEDRPIGGLGIFLVRSIMDSVSYRRYEGKNILSMKKSI